MADTYPLQPNRIQTVGIQFKTTVVTFESGYEQRSADWNKPKKTFRLIHQYLDEKSLKTLTDFFTEKKGGFQKFYFVNHIDGQTYTVRFKSDSLTVERVNAYFSNVEVEVVEC
ncbi:DUF2460 domain-containing protein [Deferribacter abyssi]|uniref:DUF2460 domain-containing protein n=1 Tax=Deferribacter abyssi TaxID=213806 RepID=UPI003C2478B6